MNTLISVIIPTYNRKRLALEAIRSVLQQEPKNYEVLVVDDGSTDDTKEYLESINLPIKVISISHGGISAARNAGIKAAKGKYIAFLDSDDLWLPGILSAQSDYLDSHPETPLVYVDQFIESNGKREEKTRFTSEQITSEQKAKFDKPGFIVPQAPIHASAVMVRKSIFDEVGLFNEELKIHEDTDMWNRISEKYPLGFIEEPLSVFRWEIDPEHALKPDSRQLFISEGRKYMQLYEDRHKKIGLTESDKKDIEASYQIIEALEQLVSLWESKKITEEEFQKKKADIFTKTDMTAEKVLQIIQTFDEAKVKFWIAGGWAVDALVGNQTRPHNDLDVAFDAHDENRIIEAFNNLGFLIEDDDRPTRFVLRKKDGAVIDLHPVVFDELGIGRQLVPGGEPFIYPLDAFSEGTIAGVRVPCLSAKQLIEFHKGYVHLEKDKHNMKVLGEHLEMNITQYPEVNEALNRLLSGIKETLGEKLIGLYLDGSLVMGDFDLNISDIDLTAILGSDLDDKEFNALKKMHEELVMEYKVWDDRIEVCYISADALNSTRTKISPIVNISPGEPFHRTKTQKEWLMNWYLIREKSITLFGPDPKTIIDPISKEEFIQNVIEHVKAWDNWVKDMRNRYAQAYAILTMCRALYAFRNGDQVSKKQAAFWAKEQLPEWSTLINKALEWREAGKHTKLINDESAYPETLKFVDFIRNQIINQ